MENLFRLLNDDKGVFYGWYEAMHTRVDVILCNQTESKCIAVVQRIKQEIDQLERIANRFNKESELSFLNHTAGIRPVMVSNELYTILSDCIKLHRQTCGCFDIAIQSTAGIEDRMGHIVMNDTHQTVMFSVQGVTLDLCGYIKGYALDIIREVLTAEQIPDALVSLGSSSVLAMGDHPAGEGWKVDLDFPLTDAQLSPGILLKNQVLTTSGNNRIDRKHIRHPQTGQWITGVQGVSVVTPTGAEGEALSIALLVATPVERAKILATFPYPYFDLR